MRGLGAGGVGYRGWSVRARVVADGMGRGGEKLGGWLEGGGGGGQGAGKLGGGRWQVLGEGEGGYCYLLVGWGVGVRDWS